MLFARSKQVAAPLLTYPALTFPLSLADALGNWQSLCCKCARAVAVDEWMLRIQPPSPQCNPSCSLTSQSIQLTHPAVLILLGNDLKNREWKTLLEESAVPGGPQLPSCVHTMRNHFLLTCFANVLLSHGPGPSRAKSYCKHNAIPVFPNFRWDTHC